MSPLAWVLVFISQVALVAAQIFLKQAMSRREKDGRWIGRLILGITTMTVWFLLWLGVMHEVQLSKLMPLEGISPLLIVIGASVVLKERLHARAWLGIALTCAGVVLVSAS
jgi:undecaprenyl phosphate-alpha-L-ara4N flippase subunit ArnE